MRNLFILLVIVAGSFPLYTKFQSTAASACDENGNPQTLLFTMNRCKSCVNAKRNFKALEAPGTPLVYVGYRRIDDLNRKKLDQALLAYQHWRLQFP